MNKKLKIKIYSCLRVSVTIIKHLDPNQLVVYNDGKSRKELWVDLKTGNKEGAMEES